MAIICKSCGNDVPEENKFCDRCGTPIDAENMDSQGDQGLTAIGINVPGANISIRNGCAENPQSYNSTINVVHRGFFDKHKILIIVAVVIVGVLGMLLSFSSDSKNGKKNNAVVVTKNVPVESNSINQEGANKSNADSKAQMNDASMVKNEVVQVFSGFHKSITKKNYRDAYDCLSSDFKNEVSYEGWVPGFKTTVKSTPKDIKIVSQSSNIVELSYTLEAVDNPGGTKYFTGTAILILNYSPNDLSNAMKP